jgi:hypothetical protein
MASGRQGVPTNDAQIEAFLVHLASTGNVTASASVAKISRETLYQRRKVDEDFRNLWDAATDLGIDALEDEATRRASEGTDEPVYQGGKLVGTVRKYSDILLMFMLKARRPDRFKDRVANEHTGANGGPIEEIRRVIVDPRNPDAT